MKTSKTRSNSRRSHPKKLQVRVMSPRIAWFSFVKLSGKALKFSLFLGIFAAIGWACKLGFEEAFYKNPEFQLKTIQLTENPILDEAELGQIIGINPPPNLFSIDIPDLEAKLSALPGVASARADRRVPGTLAVTIVPRVPRAWIFCPEAGLNQGRHAGAMLVDQNLTAYICPEKQLKSAVDLPAIRLPMSENFPIQAGLTLKHPELSHCLWLLDAIIQEDAKSVKGIDSIRQVNEWSLLLVTHQGTEATFGLGDHERQIKNFRSAISHSADKGYTIKTINLLPERNVPITIATEAAIPRAIPVAKSSEPEISLSRREKDLKTLLNRN
jgi:POTRA domain, FtsQ-type